MFKSISDYEHIVGKRVIAEISSIAENIKDLKVLHVALSFKPSWAFKILDSLIPLFKSVGINAEWVMITETTGFLSNPESLIDPSDLNNHDLVVVYDVDLMPLVLMKPNDKKWIWRCYVEVPCGDYAYQVLRFAGHYNALILPCMDYELLTGINPTSIHVIPPSIDPLSERNKPLRESEVLRILEKYDVNPDRPIIGQIVSTHHDLELIVKTLRPLKDKTKAQIVVISPLDIADEEVASMSLNDVFFINGTLSDREFNAIQRAFTLTLHISMSKNFEVTVLEAMWKGIPVITLSSGNTSSIVIDGVTGLIASTPLEACEKAITLLKKRWLAREIGENSREYVKRNFLITRDLRDNLKLYLKLTLNS